MATQLSEFGISLAIPEGWYGEIYRHIWGEFVETGPVVHVATTPLVLADQNGYAPLARLSLRPSDAILVIVNLPSLPNIVAAEGVERVPPSRPWSLEGASSDPFTGVPSTQSSLRKGIQVGERVFDVVAFFGTTRPASDLVARVNDILGSVSIAAKPPAPGNRVEQFFEVSAALAIQAEARDQIWKRDQALATAGERDEHRRAFPTPH